MSRTGSTRGAPAGGTRPRVADSRAMVAVLALAGLTVAVAQSLLIPVLPELPATLGVSVEDASWLITVSLVSGAVAIPSITRLADMHGKRRMILLTLVICTVGSVIGAVWDSFMAAFIARALQGVGLALIPVGISIFRDELPRERLGTAVAFMSATLGIGTAMALPLSGFVYVKLGWHALFLVSAILTGVIWVLARLTVPESPVRAGGRFDLLGALLLSAVLTTMLLGITKGGVWGWTSARTIACLAGSLVLLAVWLPVQWRRAYPVVDLRTSVSRPVLLTNVASLLAGFAMYTNLLSATEILQLPTATGYGFGFDSLQAGLLMLPTAAVMVVVSPASARITRHAGAKTTLVIGCGVLAVGYLLRMPTASHAWQVVVFAMVVTTGTAIAYSALPVLIMRSVPVTETASANGLNTVVRSVGTASASAAVAAILVTMVVPGAAPALPTPQAFQAMHALAAVAAVLATIAALALPRRAGRLESAVSEVALAGESVVRGHVVDDDGRPVPHARLRVVVGGEQLADWFPCDADGAFAVAVPTAVASALVADHGGTRGTLRIVIDEEVSP